MKPCYWTEIIPKEEGFYFISYTKNPEKDKLIRLEKVKRDSNGRLYNRIGYVDNETHRNGLISTKIDDSLYNI